MLVTLFILFNGWILYLLMKPAEESVLQQFEADDAHRQVEVASLHHGKKIIEVDADPFNNGDDGARKYE
ncbi:hypothetical protein [Bacillus sp. Marseille-Q3570]|uniref:hypothetical protein n=1 Tax=Bacillus sp. Marseille-Q3570 TaxID=2963522 RepID=UPI0021B7BF66|nr:hypothetical protein [Bacillus sp. Marseille-Q3570]